MVLLCKDLNNETIADILMGFFWFVFFGVEILCFIFIVKIKNKTNF